MIEAGPHLWRKRTYSVPQTRRSIRLHGESLFFVEDIISLSTVGRAAPTVPPTVERPTDGGRPRMPDGIFYFFAFDVT